MSETIDTAQAATNEQLTDEKPQETTVGRLDLVPRPNETNESPQVLDEPNEEEESENEILVGTETGSKSKFSDEIFDPAIHKFYVSDQVPGAKNEAGKVGIMYDRAEGDGFKTIKFYTSMKSILSRFSTRMEFIRFACSKKAAMANCLKSKMIIAIMELTEFTPDEASAACQKLLQVWRSKFNEASLPKTLADDTLWKSQGPKATGSDIDLFYEKKHLVNPGDGIEGLRTLFNGILGCNIYTANVEVIKTWCINNPDQELSKGISLIMSGLLALQKFDKIFVDVDKKLSYKIARLGSADSCLILAAKLTKLALLANLCTKFTEQTVILQVHLEQGGCRYYIVRRLLQGKWIVVDCQSGNEKDIPLPSDEEEFGNGYFANCAAFTLYEVKATKMTQEEVTDHLETVKTVEKDFDAYRPCVLPQKRLASNRD